MGAKPSADVGPSGRPRTTDAARRKPPAGWHAATGRPVYTRRAMRSLLLGLSSLLLCACGGAAPPPLPPVDLPAMPPPEVHAHHDRPRPVPLTTSSASASDRPTAAKVGTTPAYDEMVAAKDRSDADRALDAGRHPAELLAALGLKPGMRVAELCAGGGYTTELLARAVGPTGKVYAENNAAILGFVGDKWTERLKKPVMKNVVRVDRELDAPLPPDAKGLDAVVMVLFYHDTVWMGADRLKMDKAILSSLRKGGQFVVVDHTALEGHGIADVKTLHRIDELWTIRDVERAGFLHEGDDDFLRNPSDTRDWSASPGAAGERRGTSDRFVAKFVKP